MTQPAPTITLGYCSACIYWHPLTDTTKGECRYNAPARPAERQGPALWPRVRPNDWCGQFIAGTPPS